MTGHARQVTLRRPATVAIHDDGDVSGHISGIWNAERRTDVLHGCADGIGQPGGKPPGRPYTVMISFSFSPTSLSISATYLSVSF